MHNLFYTFFWLEPKETKVQAPINIGAANVPISIGKQSLKFVNTFRIELLGRRYISCYSKHLKALVFSLAVFIVDGDLLLAKTRRWKIYFQRTWTVVIRCKYFAHRTKNSKTLFMFLEAPGVPVLSLAVVIDDGDLFLAKARRWKIYMCLGTGAIADIAKRFPSANAMLRRPSND